MNRSNFRKLLLFQLALQIIIILIAFGDFSLGMPESIRQAEALHDAYEENKMDSKSTFELGLMFGSYFLGLVAMVGGLIGLYFFKRWGIWLSVVTVIGVVPIVNYSLQFELVDWVTATLTYWEAVSTGFIISVALLTSTNQEFK